MPAFGKGSPAFGKGSPAFGKGSPASGKGSPASGKGSPASGKGSPASGKGSPASGKADHAPIEDQQVRVVYTWYIRYRMYQVYTTHPLPFLDSCHPEHALGRPRRAGPRP
ncbi:hypothetical protein GCM10022223_63600 [Kineosporia mesophila]|uniref:Uncharacterized protein n=1 Tax=Kineosporia mesophila TaxID=566012 RepID=A0ABP7ANF1_9ACTN